VVGCLFFFPAPIWYKLVGFISIAAVFSYIMGGVGLPVLRKTEPDLERPFTLKPAMLWSLVSYLAAVVILYWAGFQMVTDLFIAVFVGLPLFSGYYVWKKGWANPVWSGLLSVVFVVLWVYMAVASGWVALTGTPGSAPDDWSFASFYSMFCVLVLAYAAVLWGISNAEGRQHVNATWWMLVLALATMLVGYFSAFGPKDVHAALQFPWGTLVELGVGIVTFFWGVASGFETEEIKDIVASETREREPGQVVRGS
jgi:amino acid transporter